MMSLKLICAVFLFTIVIGNGAGEIYYKKGAPFVRLANQGLISGILRLSREGKPFSTFAGIPYATVPERFAESELITEKQWEGVRRSSQPGPMCPQMMIPPSLGTFVGEEDCIHLNVHAPMNSTMKKVLPVMVFLHGGGFVYGTGSMYGPKYFMDEEVILVTIQYRLGAFGFLSTGDDVLSGNMGIRDMINALRWVRNNIVVFGGNPNQVTIFGESAGGAAVHYLMLSPMAKGLFHRAIAQSGSALGPWAHESNPRKNAEKLAKYLGCPITSSEEIVACLRGKSTDELNRGQFSFDKSFPNNLIPLFFGPTTETKTSKSPLITESPWEILTDKNSKVVNDVPLMIGATEHEGVHMFSSIVLGNEDLLKEINDNWDTVAPNAFLLDKSLASPEALKKVTDKIRRFYFKDDAISKEKASKLTDLYSDSFIFHGLYRTAVETALRSTSKKSQVYLYQYAHQSKFPLMSLLMGGKDMDASKVGHADELPFLFSMDDVPGAETLVAPNSKDEIFSKNLVRTWVSFAKNGEPTHMWGNVKKWNPISKEEATGVQALQILKLDNEPSIVHDTIYKERILFWNTIWEKHLLKGGRANNAHRVKTEL